MKKYVLSAIALFLSGLIAAMENNADTAIAPTQLYVIPGQNGHGCEPWHVQKVLGNHDVEVPNPYGMPDMGQGLCISRLATTLNEHPEHTNIIVYAVSQGTATLLNYLAETGNQCIKCAILQAPLVSGNSAILHTLSGPLMDFPRLANLPFAYYWIPYCAKILFPWYWPAGKQPIKSIQKINRDIPTVIVHSKDDPQLPYSGACALYYGLRSQGHKNVYFISKNTGGHMYLLNEDDKPVIDRILVINKLKQQSPEYPVVDLSPYQPDHMPFKKHYDDLMFKEKNHTRLKYAAAGALALVTAYFLRNKINLVLDKIVPMVRTMRSGIQNGISRSLISSSLFSFAKNSHSQSI